ncbi:MAG: DNA cytosine methyltransferase [Defluviitaleaceae bacterium]|nr:DNA cytosine methyltransferase [Defluviitaleaceae bacterium]
MLESKKYNVIDLFCGCGGFSLGFLQAGFNVRLGIDIWADATTTYKHNISNASVLNEDINAVTGDSITKFLDLGRNDIDIIIGGPPCQGFSVSGKRNENDPRNELYKSFVRIVEDIKPKIFVLENVPGLVRLFNGKAIENVISDFSGLGYKTTYEILSSDNYGVPQQRRRVFLVGINTDKIKKTCEFVFPEKTFGTDIGEPLLTSKNAISDLDFVPDDVVLGESIKYQLPAMNDYQKKMRTGSDTLLNHSITLHKVRTKEIIAMVPDGGNYKSLPKELWSTRKVNIAWTRMDSSRPCFTIDTGHNHHFHYRANRVPTVRESARIQSFPDTFEFIGIKTSQLKQVGNAVPPLMAEAIAQKIKILLDKEYTDV